MAGRMGGAVRMSLGDYEAFPTRFDKIAATQRDDGIIAVHSTQVINDVVTHSTSRARGHSRATTMMRWGASNAKGSDAHIAVWLEGEPDTVLGTEVLAAVGFEEGMAKDLITRRPVQRMASDGPSFAHELMNGMEGWFSTNFPSIVVLLRNDSDNANRISPVIHRALLPEMRRAHSMIQINHRIAETCNVFLQSHGIDPLADLTACVLVNRGGRLIDHFRATKHTRQLGRTLTLKMREAHSLIAEDLSKFFDDVRVEAAVPSDGSDRLAELERELESARAEVSRSAAAAERSQTELVRERRTVRSLAHQLADVRLSVEQSVTEAPTEPSTGERVTSEPPVAASARAEEIVPDSLAELSFTTFKDLLVHAESTLERVVLCESVWAPAGDLDRHHLKAAAWRERVWGTLLAMDGYAAARANGMSASFPNWLAEQPQPLVSPAKVIITESGYNASDSMIREARIFPVPPAVDASGRAFMGAHVQIESGSGSPTPRLHFLDNTAGTGNMYVGYIGKHLRCRRFGA